MSLRSWAIRGMILAGVAALVALVWLANSWVSPERVRAQVVAHLSEQFEGADVHVGAGPPGPAKRLQGRTRRENRCDSGA